MIGSWKTLGNSGCCHRCHRRRWSIAIALGRKFVITTVGGGGPDVAGVVEEMYYTARERERDKKEWYRY